MVCRGKIGGSLRRGHRAGQSHALRPQDLDPGGARSDGDGTAIRLGSRAGGAPVKGRAFGSPLARGLYPRTSTAEVDPRASPGPRPLWIAEGYGYEITGLDVREAHDRTIRAAEIIGCRENALSHIRKLAEKNSDGGRILAAILRQVPGGMR
jgi:hypothetical protein